MTDRADQAVQALISRATSLLEGLEDVEQLVSGNLPGATAPVDGEAREEEIESIRRSMGLAVDGWFDVEVSPDEMLCLGHFHPPKEGGNPVNLEDFRQALTKRGVTSGIDWSAAELAVLRCNTEREEVSNVVVARGTVPQDAFPAHIELDASAFADSPVVVDAVSVDHRERSAFRFVKRGDVLARRVPPKPGARGMTVTGRSVPFKTHRIAGTRAGSNTETSADSIIASCDGRLLHDDRSFSVSRVLHVGGDLDYHTGNVDFAGDVIVEGMVKDGFTLKSAGAVLCHKAVGASEVSATSDVVLRSGFIGRDRGRILAGGKFEAKFVENGYVEAHGDMRVEVGAMNSALYTLGMLETGAKAIIVGGKIVAADGVDAMHIGSRMGFRTEICCGINYVVMQKLDWVRDNVMKLAQRIREVERVKSSGKGSPAALVEVEAKLRGAMTKLNQTSIRLIPSLDKNESAQVVAHGTVYPGVYVEICHIPCIVQREVSKVRFRLDKTQGKVVIERLLR